MSLELSSLISEKPCTDEIFLMKMNTRTVLEIIVFSFCGTAVCPVVMAYHMPPSLLQKNVPVYSFRHDSRTSKLEQPSVSTLLQGSPSKTWLTMSLGANPAFRAGSALISSSLVGSFAERKFPNSGILVTMSVAAALSNLSLAPSHHLLYDVCWSTFLPASLALLLLGRPSSTIVSSDEGEFALQSTNNVIKTVSAPFLIASLGSILGCTISFLLCRKFPTLWLNPKDAAIAAGCLCASFIGGSVNFFATASSIGEGNITTLLSSMAAADLLVMAIYFAAMAAALESKRLLNAFSGGTSNHYNKAEEAPQDVNEDFKDKNEPQFIASEQNLHTKVQAGILVSALALVIVKISAFVESMTASILPGVTCGVIALITPPVQQFLTKKRSSLVQKMQRMALPLSDFAFQLLFASVGTSANLGEALRQGPACLSFSLSALVVHIVVVFAGSLRAKRFFHLPLILEDVLVASNAAIGGPATAAAFAGRMKSTRQRGLTMAGTFWGVVGYAVGTTVGVTLYKALSSI